MSKINTALYLLYACGAHYNSDIAALDPCEATGSVCLVVSAVDIALPEPKVIAVPTAAATSAVAPVAERFVVALDGLVGA